MLLETHLNGKLIQTKSVKKMRMALRKEVRGMNYVVVSCTTDKSEYSLIVDNNVVGYAVDREKRGVI